MGIHYIGRIIVSEVLNTRNFHLHHFELLPLSSSTDISIEVCVFYIYDHIFSESVSAAKSCELMLPIHHLVYFISPHCQNINYMYERRNLIDQNEGTDSTELRGQGLRKEH